MKLFYAEKIEDCKIVERGIFTSIEEFVPYRKLGWSGTQETDKATDELISSINPDVLCIN